MNIGEGGWIRDEVIPSQLVTNMYTGFKIRTLRDNETNGVNSLRYNNLARKNTPRSITDLDNVVYYDDECQIAENVYETIESVDLFVCVDSICIQGGQTIPIGATIKSSCLIPTTSVSKEDSLILSIDSGRTLVIRLSKSDYGIYEIVVLDILDCSFIEIICNHSGSKVFGTSFFKNVSVFDINYSQHGSPVLCLQKNLVVEANNINGCLLSITPTDDLFVNITNSFENCIIMECYSNIEHVGHSNLVYRQHMMSNKFEIPSFVIPLENTKSVLFLQETMFTVKGSCFLLTGSGHDQSKMQYPSGFSADNYYIPKNKIVLPNQGKYDGNSQHDQVLVSFSQGLKFSIYSLDVKFIRDTATFELSLQKLFSMGAPASIFAMEKNLNDRYIFTYFSTYGFTESRMVDLVVKPADLVHSFSDSLFKVNFGEIVYSRENFMPVFDYKFINNPNKRIHNEMPHMEFWCSGRAGDKNRLMNVKRGYIGSKEKLKNYNIQFKKFGDVELMKYFVYEDEEYILLSNYEESGIFKLDGDFSSSLFEYSKPTHCFNYCVDSESYIRVLNDEIILGNGSVEIKSIPIDEEILFATSLRDIIVICTTERFQYFAIAENNDNLIPLLITNDSSSIDINLVTMVHLDEYDEFANQYDDEVLLFVGYVDSLLIFRFDKQRSSLVLLNTVSFENMQMVSEMRSTPFGFILTSLDGYYSFLLHEQNQWMSYHETRLSNKSPLRIIQVDGLQYTLMGEQLWKIDMSSSVYAKPIVIDGFTNNTLHGACVRKDGKLIVSRNSGVWAVDVSNYEDNLVKSFKFEWMINELNYLEYLKTFVMITSPFPSSKSSSVPKLGFFDVKSRKPIEWSRQNESETFEKNEYIESVTQMEIEKQNGNKDIRVLIVCRMNGSREWSIKLCTMRLTSEGKMEIQSRYSWIEKSPVKCIVSHAKNHIMYSTGNEIKQRVYVPESKKLSATETKMTYDSPIKSFEVKDGKLLVITTEDSYQLSDLETGRKLSQGKERYLAHSVMQGDCGSSNEIVLSTADNSRCTITVVDTNHETNYSFNINALPRISANRNLASVLSHETRMQILSHACFLSVGMAGQMDVFTYVDGTTWDQWQNAIRDAEPVLSIRGKMDAVGLNWVSNEPHFGDGTLAKRSTVMGLDGLQMMFHRFML